MSNEPQVKKIYTIRDCDFPCLNEPNDKNEDGQSQIIDVTNVTFVKVASTIKIEDHLKEDKLKSGWISLKMNKTTRDIEISLGPKTQEIIENEKKLQNQDLNYDMNCAINKIEQKRLHFEKSYDEIHGEGKYEEVYKYYENSINLSDNNLGLNDEYEHEHEYEYEHEYDYYNQYYLEDLV